MLIKFYIDTIYIFFNVYCIIKVALIYKYEDKII